MRSKARKYSWVAGKVFFGGQKGETIQGESQVIETRFRVNLINPVYWPQRELQDFVRRQGKRSFANTLLDVGCGTMPYRRYFSAQDYVGLEVQDSGASEVQKHPTEWFDGVKIDKPDSSVDAVLCTQVLEHAELHAKLLGEIFRVLKPGGELILTVPFVYEEHEQPFDFRRWTSFGLIKDLEEAGFRDLHLEKLTCGLRALVTLSNQQICKSLSKIPAAASLWMLTGGLVLNLLGLVIGSKVRLEQSFFLDLGAVAQKPL